MADSAFVLYYAGDKYQITEQGRNDLIGTAGGVSRIVAVELARGAGTIHVQVGPGVPLCIWESEKQPPQQVRVFR